jgi:hypothetical protein
LGVFHCDPPRLVLGQPLYGLPPAGLVFEMHAAKIGERQLVRA